MLSHLDDGTVGFDHLLCCSRRSRWHVYNVPPSDELGAIIPGRFTYGDQLDSHIVLVTKKSGVQTSVRCLTLYTPQ